MAGSTVVVRFIGDDSSLRRAANRSARALDEIGPKITGVGLGLIGLGSAGVIAGTGIAAGMALVPLAVGGVAALIISKNEQVKKSFESVGKSLSDNLTKAAQPLVPVFLGIANRLNAFIVKIGPQLGALFSAAAPMISQFADALMGFIAWLIPRFTELTKAAQPFVTALLNGLGSLGPKIDQMFAAMGAGAGGAVTSVGMFFNVLGDGLVLLGQVLGFLMQYGPALTQLIAPGLALIGVIKAWTIAQGILNVVMAANPFGLVVLAIAALVAGFVWAYNNVQWFHDGVIAFFGGLGAFVTMIASNVVSGWNRVMAFFSALPGAVGRALGALGGIISSTFKGGLNLAISLLNWGIDKINGLIGGINTIGGFVGISIPSIPHIPRFHSGGLVPGVGRQETVAVLQAGERVIPRSGSAPGGGGTLRVSGSADSQVATLVNYLVRTKQITLA